MKLNKWAIITGASSGIGLELARVFAQRDCNLIITARNETALNAVAGELRGFNIEVVVLVADLSKPDAPAFLYGQLQERNITIDYLVNNAGFATYGFFAQTSLEDELQMISVNIAALTHLTKLFLPGMKQRRSGRILNVASTAAFQPGPLMAVYYATKAYVLSFTEALANELEGSGVHISALCPGPTASGFQERAQMTMSKLVSGQIMDARSVAEAGYRGLMRNQTIIIPGRKARMFAGIVRFLPRKTTTKIVRRVQAPDK